MNPVPLIPDTAPFSPEQRAWLNGFFAGVFSRTAQTPNPGAQTLSPAALQPLTILFGSQTGTAEGLAKKMAKEAGKRGFAATVLDMAQADLARLSGEKNLLVITSTYGDGEPPDNAKALHTALKTAGDRPLTSVRFSVCSLGDTNYAQFCQCGKDFDAQLERLGATRATPRTDCDLDYDAPFTKWLDTALAALAPTAAAPLENPNPKTENTPEAESGYSRKNPFPAPVLTVRNLNGPGSAKEVNHVEFSLEGSGLVYEAGDALGVVPHNCPALVADVLATLGCDGEEAVPTPTGELPLRRALTECYDLGKPSAELMALMPTIAGAAGSGSGSPGPTTNFHHVIDVLVAAPTKPSPAALVGVLRKIQPRLYSISSSPKAHAGQVHLTVGAVRYEKDGRARKGVCSTFLAERGLAAGKVGVFVHSNKAFRPPASGDTPMIMVGPGTGIAPFRAFLAERRATGAKGKNWLFFGDQKAASDFLYREELAGLQESGVLTRLDLAFSRDQAEKIYVQQRMLEAAAELYNWLEQGAHFYVCGDASRMAKDVDAALHQVVEKAGGKTAEQAAAYVQALKAARRYQRDVY
jgi:sulfite reductase (NADPH) flavoprotein alpha-component